MLVTTCSVGVVVAFQPSLHSNQVMLINKEDDVFRPENLICGETPLDQHVAAAPFHWQGGS